MKFLCRNCKAKYQIADDKVAGRTLRMTCQQCGENITVRGPGATRGPASQPLNQSVARSTSMHPSALGADFQRQVVAPPPEPMARATVAEWHVAINDVPVGPMRRDEVSRKISAGAVDREALAWREGMDDWMPIKHIPELLALFPAASMGAPQPSAAAPQVQVPVQPAARVEMAPIGGRQIMSLDDYAQPLEISAPAMTVSPLASMPPTPQESGAKPLGWAQMFALVSGGAMIMMLGAVLGVRVLAPPTPAPVAAPVAAAPVAAPTPTPQPQLDDQGRTIELDMQAIDGQSGSNTPRRPGSAPAADKGKPAVGANGKPLTEEQKAMLARMGGGNLDQGPNLRAPTETTKSSGGGGGQLTAGQLSEVVNRGRKNLQRCYEVALRGANSDDTVRLDVEIEVSPNGNVTNAHTTGKGLPGMEECITRTVRMWRFPTSGDVTQTRFPVVFQPGA